MGDLVDLIIKKTSKLGSLNKVCSNFIITLNKDIVKITLSEY